MDPESSPDPPPPPVLSEPSAPTAAERTVALLEVLLCSDYPTQFALGATFATFGFHPQLADGSLNIAFVAALSLADTVVLVGMIVAFLRSHNESPREVFFGRRPVLQEVGTGLPLILVAYVIAIVVLMTTRAFAPWLRTVELNPLQGLMKTPMNAALFAVVVVIAGGVREELQRAFLLRRFEQSLGGRTVGVVATSLGFGLGHVVQGADAIVATALLGAFWAVTYLRRRSVVAPMVSHGGFDLLQIVQFLTLGR